MKAAFNRKKLLDAFATVSSVAPARSPKPILQNVLMTIDGAEATLIGTDLEIGVRKTIGESDVLAESPGSVVLPTDRFGSILRTSSDEQVHVELDGDKILVKTKSGRFNLHAEDPATFPEVPGFDAEAYAVMVDHDLIQMIRTTSYAADPASNRYALGGSLVEFEEGSVVMVCTDGRRLAKAVYPAEFVGDLPNPGQPVVPIKALKLIERSLPGDGSQVHLAIQANKAAMVRAEDAVIYSRLVEGRYPRYTDAIPKSAECRVPFKAAILRSAVEQAAVCLDKESKGVELAFGEGRLTLTATAADVGTSRVVVEYGDVIAGLDRKVTLGASYVLDVLKSLDGEAVVTLGLNESDKPVTATEGDRLTAVVMPIVQG